ncbi:outer membrane protein [Aureimonas altamirensis]|uniref:outer membrane protein n=1 Tax=Aureimonas altamirensis TaxID=370622 RepID=UPI00068A5834|nr:outer membrane protein [Aureimonas altamirensis]
MRLNHRILASAALTFALTAPALAADVVFEEPAAPVAAMAPVAQDWTGFSVGVFAGGATGDAKYSSNIASENQKTDFDGLLGGVQVGYDQQLGTAVIGARASIAATNIDNGDAVIESKLKYLGTAGVRAGVALDKLLPYVHGGFAFGQTKQETSATVVDASKLDKANHTGWTAGVGAEYAVTQNVSVGAEYGYVDLGKENTYTGNYTVGSSTTASTVDEDLTFHTFKAGVNFRF